MVSATQITEKLTRALDKLGTTGVFTTISTAGSYDVDTGEVTSEVTTTATVRCSPPVDYRAVYKATGSGKDGIAIVYCMTTDTDGAAFVPTTSMEFVLASKTLTINAVREYIWKDTLVAYELEVSGG